MKRKLTYLTVFLALTYPNIYSQPGIFGKLVVDTTIWTPTVYISFIPDFENMYRISNEMIIDKAEISDSGSFVFNTKYLPDDDVLLRFHLSKKGDLPASLIIGGKDENHFFVIANRTSIIKIKSTSNFGFPRDINLQGYSPNQTIQQINKIAIYLDTADLNGPIIKTEFIRNAIFEKLRSIADTCANPLVALYALYKSKFDRNYSVNQQFYKNFLAKWRHEKSTYFTEFRKKIPYSRSEGFGLLIFACFLSLAVGYMACLTYIKVLKKKRNLIENLSVQERKIFALLLEGKSNKEISENLMIGLSTVKSHVNNIYSKLDVKSRKDVLNLDRDNNKKNAL